MLQTDRQTSSMITVDMAAIITGLKFVGKATMSKLHAVTFTAFFLPCPVSKTCLSKACGRLVCVCVCMSGRVPKCATAVCAYGLVIMIVCPHIRCLSMTRDEPSVCYHCPPTDIWPSVVMGFLKILNNTHYPHSFLREIYSRYDRKK